MKIVVAYGTETYNSEGLAHETADMLAQANHPCEVLDLQEFSPSVLSDTDVLLIITSTFGDGEPPSNAQDAYDFIMSDEVQPLGHLKFSVCGLGDTEYEHFCQCGKDFDLRLEQLGAQRIAPRADCDTDYDDLYQEWVNGVVRGLGQGQSAPRLRESLHQHVPDQSVAAPSIASSVDDRPSVAMQSEPNRAVGQFTSSKDQSQTLGTRKNPYLTKVLENRNLNHPFSEKATRHIVLALPSGEVNYKVGDALGVFPRNCPDLVRQVLEAAQLPRDVAVSFDGQWYPIRDVLLYKVDVVSIDKRMLKLLSEHHSANHIRSMLADRKAVSDYVASHHLIDLLRSCRVKPDATDFVNALKPLAPRLYSIASSPNYHPNEVHLTVDVLSYELHGSVRRGCSSSFLADRAGAGVEVAVYVQPTKDFVLCDDDAPMIMIGPGTGIAPFRAFLEEREHRNAAGQSWLFFGAQRSARDFLYREELLAWKESGRLVRLDTAFSRDQEKKIYVQDRLLEHAHSIFHWLESGAYIYVCGDASRMAKDVNEALTRIVEVEGKQTRRDAESYIKALTKSGRYRRDVY